MECGKVELEDSRENHRTDSDKSSVDMPIFAFDFDPDAILLGYSGYVDNTGR